MNQLSYRNKFVLLASLFAIPLILFAGRLAYTYHMEVNQVNLTRTGLSYLKVGTDLIQDLETLRANNWLITDASLTLYVDQNASSNIIPEQLFIYNFDDKEQLEDAINFAIGRGTTSIGGVLERDEDGKPYKYVFNITATIAKILKLEDPDSLFKFGVSVFNSSDRITSIDDISISNYSWTPKGVVLYNHNASEDKKVKLEVTYTELNN